MTAPRAGFAFGPDERINLDRAVERILRHGHTFTEQFLTLAWLERPKQDSETVLTEPLSRRPACRLAIRIGPHFKSAVSRNHVKRLLREVFRRHKREIIPGIDLLLIARFREGVRRMGYSEAENLFRVLCRRAGIWEEI